VCIFLQLFANFLVEKFQYHYEQKMYFDQITMDIIPWNFTHTHTHTHTHIYIYIYFCYNCKIGILIFQGEFFFDVYMLYYNCKINILIFEGEKLAIP
jgi:hypothetical protein